MTNKWYRKIVDDINPRKARNRTPKLIQTYKLWTIKGQVIKALESLSPTTPKIIFKALVDNHTVSDNPDGLQSVRRALRELQREQTITVDLSVRKFVPQEYGTESLIILGGNRKYTILS